MLEAQSGGGLRIDLPDFDLYPWDYLRFAEDALEKHTKGENRAELVNCVSNLKRALDCAVTIFLDGLNLRKVFDRRNLKIEKKLEFLRESGVFTARSLSRLNGIRNRMEHDFEVPLVKDLDAFFDIVSVFVALLDATLASIAVSAEKDYSLSVDTPEEKFGVTQVGYFEYKYNLKIPSIHFAVKKDGTKHEHEYEFTLAEPGTFAKALRLLLILAREGWMLGTSLARERIEELAGQPADATDG